MSDVPNYYAEWLEAQPLAEIDWFEIWRRQTCHC